MQTSKSRSSLEAPKKVSLKAARQVKPAALKCDSSSSSNQTGRISKERSPKIIGRSSRTPLSEKKCQNKISELESQISILQKDLKKAKEQLHSSKLRKDRARVDAEVSSAPPNAKEHRLSSSEQGHPKELQKRAQEDEQSLHSASEVTEKSESVDSVALAMVNVTQQLKLKLQVVDESKAFQMKHAGSASEKHSKLKKLLSEILSLMGSMKNQLQDCEVSETQVQALISETTAQVETAKEMVELLGSDSTKAFEDWNSVTSELDESREHVNILETLVHKLEPALANASWKASEMFAVGKNREQETPEGETRESELLEADFRSLQSEVEQLKSAPVAAKAAYEGEQGQSTLELKSSTDAKHVKSDANLRELELKKELEKSRVEIDEFKAKLLNRETELRSITEENLELSCKLEKSLSSHRVYELEKELEDLKNCIADLKANLLDKETEFQSVSEENEMLISEISKRDTIKTKVKDETTIELATSATIERDTQVKLGIIAEETDRNTSRKSIGVAELEAAQAANAEMEMELRTLKVQSEQWRKAAEAAAAMISAGSNGEFVGRTGSMDSNYNAITGKIGPLYTEDSDDDLLKKKNVNVLRKIGVLWKKPQK
ncbi:interactor of constitutive active ROPs 3-like [Benincasa hispida]|uniref:interactor of constitutive active ROPs 3-like n=1 Tax=Benincasa hispida TaxID=102211 RepID=UPI0019010F14|nr:interactor of constitutive active ROPs 3-like [Benincasa hispida]XP_038902645.1 interactor of constitutive active ROPs 3-like [Benincasa hispida]